MAAKSDATTNGSTKQALKPDSPFYPIPPEHMLLETPQCVAFLDKYPVSKGRTRRNTTTLRQKSEKKL